MKNINILMLLVFALTACAPVNSVQIQAVNPIQAVVNQPLPVFIDIPEAGLKFPLTPRPEKNTTAEGVPYEDGPAFWRVNGPAVEVSSHCTEVPGKYFRKISKGDSVIVSFEDGSQKTLKIVERIVIRYDSPFDPLNHDWIDQDEKHYTVQEFSNYVMDHKGAFVLHSSRCNENGSFGQWFFVAE